MGIEFGIAKLAMVDRIDFLKTLSSWLTSAGGTMPVAEAVKSTCDAFSRDEYASLAARMDVIVRDYVSGSMSFSMGLRLADLGFSEQELAILTVAEDNNQLRVAVPALVEALEIGQSSRKALLAKLTMPLVGGFMLILMSIGVMVFMLPTVMTPVIERNPDVLKSFPFIIKMYWGASVFLRANYPLVIIVVSIPVILFFIRNTSLVRPHYEKVLMGFGPARRIVLAFNALLIVYFMPALVRANMPLPEVLRVLSTTINNLQISGALKLAAYEHEHGYRLGDVLAHLPLRGSFRTAVEAGEQTGKIAERVEDLKGPYKSEFDRIVKKAVAVLMLIVMGGLLPFFIISMYTSLVTPMIALMEYS